MLVVITLLTASTPVIAKQFLQPMAPYKREADNAEATDTVKVSTYISSTKLSADKAGFRSSRPLLWN